MYVATLTQAWHLLLGGLVFGLGASVSHRLVGKALGKVIGK